MEEGRSPPPAPAPEAENFNNLKKESNLRLFVGLKNEEAIGRLSSKLCFKWHTIKIDGFPVNLSCYKCASHVLQKTVAPKINKIAAAVSRNERN